MFYFTLCIFNNNISQVPRLEAVQDVQRQHPDSARHAQAALLHRQVSASTGAPQYVPIWDILHQYPPPHTISSLEQGCKFWSPRAILIRHSASPRVQIFIFAETALSSTISSLDIILDILDMLDIPNCRDGAMFRHILNFMRTGRPMLPDTFDQWDLLLEEARYYELTGETIFCVKYWKNRNINTLSISRPCDPTDLQSAKVRRQRTRVDLGEAAC